MVNDLNTNIPEHCHDHVRTVTWSAVFAGAFVAIGLAFLLNIFSVAIGLSAFNMSQDGMATVAIGGFAALLIGSIASMYAAGWIAGFLGRPCCGTHNWGVLYGFLAWSLALALTVLLASHVGTYMNSYGQFIANPASVSTTNDQRMPAVSMDRTENKRGMEQPTQQPEMTVNMMKASNGMAMGAFILFILFFIGALSSSFGGYYGMERRRKWMTTCM